MGSLSDTQGVLIQDINRRDKKTSPGDVISVKVAVRDGTEQVIVFSRQSSAADGNPKFIYKPLQRVDVHLQRQPFPQWVEISTKDPAKCLRDILKLCKIDDVRVVLRGSYLDSIFWIVATSVHIKAGVHATAEVTPLRNGTGDRQTDQRCIMDTAFVKGPVSCGLNGVGPELKHPRGN